MKIVKIREDLWEDMVSRTKLYEFRKLTKGLTTGTYQFVSLDYDAPLPWDLCKGEEHWEECICFDIKGKVFGTAHLKPLGINPGLINWDEYLGKKLKNPGWTWFTGMDSYYSGYSGDIDEKSRKFIQKNYIDKHDFVVYKISRVVEKNETKGDK